MIAVAITSGTDCGPVDAPSSSFAGAVGGLSVLHPAKEKIRAEIKTAVRIFFMCNLRIIFVL
jgi:hypothetical protein